MKKKVISMFLALTLTLSMLSGCGVSVSGTEQNPESVSEEEAEEETEALESSEDGAETEIPADKVEQLKEIAKADGISYEDLNVKFNDEGYLTFLGHSYCDDEINDEDDALLSLENISDLIGLDGISLDFYRADTSKVSGNTYYTFYQVDETEIDGETMPVEYYNNLVKVAVDKNKKTAAVSTYLNHGDTDEVSAEDIISEDEAVEYVKSISVNPDNVIEDATKLVFWDDSLTAEQVNTGKRALAYLVYMKNADDVQLSEDAADVNSDETKDETESVEQVPVSSEDDADKTDELQCSKFLAVVVSAIKNYTDESKEDYSVRPITMFTCSSVDGEGEGEFTSMYFFEGREDAGEYTYTLSLDWVKDVYEEYDGPDTMEVTVPVIYDKSTDLYYLADYNRRIVMGNYYDFSNGNLTGDDADVNPLVSKTPEDADSWQFLNDPPEELGIEKFFCDPDYVLAVYNNMITIYDMFSKRYGLKGVDDRGYPIISTLYTFDSDEYQYPEKIMDFQYNASCAGPVNDWVWICTSPRLAAGISPTVMGHEFTHGVNQQLTSSQYFNQPGAMMESYADVIGAELALLYADDPVQKPWTVGGDYCDIMRSFADPGSYYMPKYINGANYVKETVQEFASKLDMGGVHSNSSVPNHLCYMLTHDDTVTLLDGEEIFDVGTNVDMWFETLFLATYITDFTDLAHFLTYTSTVTGASDGQRSFLDRLLHEQGYFGDCEEYEELLENEECYEISYDFDTDKDDFNDRYEMCLRNIYVKENGKIDWTPGAVIPEDGQITFKFSNSLKLIPKIYIMDKETGELLSNGTQFVTDKNPLEDNVITCHVKEVNLTSDEDDKFTVPEGEKITQISKETAEDSANALYVDGEASFTKYGKYIVITQNEESGEFNLYLITVAD